MKKKLLAFVLSAMMLTESVLPVVAADDVDVVVSENAAEEVTEDAVAEEEAATEETAAEEQSEEAVVEETAETEATEAEEAADVADAEVETDYLVISETEVMSAPFVVTSATESSDVDDQETEDVSATEHVVVGGLKTKTITADSIVINGKEYNIGATIKYNSYISFRSRQIKPDQDLGAAVTQSSLYNVARDLMTMGTFTTDVITWKWTAKKNKNAGTDACFNVKAVVNTKVAKQQLGIKGKSLSQLKKAVKKFNKVSTKKDEKIYFEITKVNAKDVYDKDEYYAWAHYSGYFYPLPFSSFKGLWLRLEPDQPKSVNSSNYKQLTKVKKSDFKISVDKKYVLSGYGACVKVTMVPKEKNFTGDPIEIYFPRTKSLY